MRIERWLYALPLRLRTLVRPHIVEQDLDDELRDHLERQTAANRASGMPPDQARRAALIAFGGVERIKEESRDTRRSTYLDAATELRQSARSLLRARAFTAATVTTIALSVGAGCTMFTLIHAILLRPLPYPHSERLVSLWHTMPGIGMDLAPQAPGTFFSYRRASQSFESIGAYAGGTATVNYDDPTLEPERVPAAGVSAAILPMLRVHPLMGRLLSDADEAVGAAAVAVVGEAFWRTRLNASPRVLGTRLQVDGAATEIVGVLPATFAFPASDVRIWMPIRVAPNAYLGSFGFRAIGRLRDGVSASAAQRELQSILMHVSETFPEVNPGMATAAALAKTRASVVIRDLRRDAIGGFERVLWLAAAIVGLLVVVALSNVASLALARAEARRREFAVRTTLGASAGRVWRSLMGEAAIVCATGGLLGSGLALAALGLVSRAGPTNFPDPRLSNGGVTVLPRLDEVHAGAPLVVSAVAIAVCFCMLIAIIGAWRVASADPSRVLRESSRSGTASTSSQRVRAAFVVIEVALSLVLLSGSAVLGRSMLRLLHVDGGFNPANVTTFWTSPRRARYKDAEDVARFYRDAAAAIARIPEVVSVGVVSKPPLESSQTRRIVWVEGSATPAGALPPDYPIAEASNGYFAALGIPLVAGRLFDEVAIRRGDNEALVSRSFVIRNWADSTGLRGLGHRFRHGGNVGPWYTIVGVVGDVRDTSLAAPAGAAMYVPEEPGLDPLTRARTARDMAFVVRTRGPVAGLTDALRHELRGVDPNVPLADITAMTATVARANSRMTTALYLLAAGALVTLALGAVGLYGVIAYVVSLRTREIGIRIALGLTPAHAARMILQQGEKIVAIGAVVGALLFLAFAKLLSSLAFEVSVVDTTAMAMATAVVVLIGTFATWLPARRAARVDPAEALKSD
jgi:putative ABC transport system permease protein